MIENLCRVGNESLSHVEGLQVLPCRALSRIAFKSKLPKGSEISQKATLEG